MTDVPDKRLKVVSDRLGTATGVCLECGATLTITIPTDYTALPALKELFKTHLAKHTPKSA